MPILSPAPEAIAEAAKRLSQGQLVALPTETVYGLGCDASSPEALAGLYAAKGRPTNHPVIVHIASTDQLTDWAMDIPEVAYTLANAFWPGPLTLILKKQPHVLDAVTGGQDTVGIRIPSHPVALELLKAFGSGIAAPSANRFGRISPTTAQHVVDELGDELTVLDGGPCTVGVESTIVDVSSGNPRILRPGMITATAVEAALGISLSAKKPLHANPEAKTPVVSGSLSKHYAPTTPTFLFSREQLIAQWESLTSEQQTTIALLLLSPVAKSSSPQQSHLILGTHPHEYATGLYAALRTLDAQSLDAIWVELPPKTINWNALHDRLKRCTAL